MYWAGQHYPMNKCVSLSETDPILVWTQTRLGLGRSCRWWSTTCVLRHLSTINPLLVEHNFSSISCRLNWLLVMSGVLPACRIGRQTFSVSLLMGLNPSSTSWDASIWLFAGTLWSKIASCLFQCKVWVSLTPVQCLGSAKRLIWLQKKSAVSVTIWVSFLR